MDCWLDKIEIFSALYGSLRYYEKKSFLYPKNQVPVLHIWSARRDSFKGIWKLILDTWTVRHVVTKDTSEFLLKNLKIKLLVDNWNLCMCITMELATKTIRDNNCLIIAKFVVFEMISLFFSHSLTVTTFAAMLKMLLFIFFIDYFNQPNVSESGPSSPFFTLKLTTISTTLYPLLPMSLHHPLCASTSTSICSTIWPIP